MTSLILRSKLAINFSGAWLTKNLVRGQNRSGGLFWKCVRYWSVRTKSGPGGISVKRTAKMLAMDSFSNEAEDLMEEVYQYMTRKRYMYLLGCMEGGREAQGEKQSSLSYFFFATVSRSFVVVLHYKLNFPFHCAILSTKVQQLRNENHHLEEGDGIWQGGTNFGNLSGGTTFR